MLIGPKGQKRPADVIANAVLIGRIATQETEEVRLSEGKRRGGQRGGRARATSLSAERRREIAAEGAEARWSRKDDTHDKP